MTGVWGIGLRIQWAMRAEGMSIREAPCKTIQGCTHGKGSEGRTAQPLMPQGVEHLKEQVEALESVPAQPLMPQGVEHFSFKL